jgi:methylmalonyl-CoA/ethylmalonyl-CoA epimerase
MNGEISHIGIAVHDLDAAVALWEGKLGFVLTHRIDVLAEGLRTAMLAPAGDANEMSVELIAPLDPKDESNVVVKHLAVKGEGFFQMALIVADLEAEVRGFTQQGIRTIEIPPAELGPALANRIRQDCPRYIVHPKSASGVLIELLQEKS